MTTLLVKSKTIEFKKSWAENAENKSKKDSEVSAPVALGHHTPSQIAPDTTNK